MNRMETLHKLAGFGLATTYVPSKMLQKKFARLLAVIAFLPLAVSAGFLEMPDTTETPEFERQSLLLDMDIPTVKDRDPNPQAGPRLNVKEFRIQGLREYPELGITREQIIKQVELLRFDMMGDGKRLESGYTLDELSKVSDLVAEIEKETKDQHVGPLEVQKLVFLIREQHRERGITLGMIETVADTITRYYREHGFILAKAYIPKQEVRDGVVTLTVLLGQLGEVSVQNNKYYSDKTITNIFKSNLGKPVTNELVEENLYLVNDFPGLSAQGYFEPGAQVGDTKLNVNVISEQRYNANVRLDNHGSDQAGKYRTYAEFLLHNPLSVGDELSLGILASFAPQNSTYGSLRYELPVVTPKLKFSVGASNNEFTLGDGQEDNLNITGTSSIVDVGVKYQLSRSRVRNHAIGLKGLYIDSKINIAGGGSIPSVLQNFELAYDFDLLNEKYRVLHQGNIAFISSKSVETSLDEQMKNPIIATVDYSRLSFIKTPFLDSESKIVYRLSGQYAGTRLASVNQYSLAGPTRARGFKLNEFYADDAVYLAADWIFKGPEFNGSSIAGERWDNLLQPFLFADYGYGIIHDLLDSNDDIKSQLVDMGFGFKFNYKENTRGNLIFATPVSQKITTLDGEEEKKLASGVNVYFDIQFGF